MMDKHNCDEVVEMLMRLLDGDLFPDEETMLIKEINKCPNCLKKHNLEQSFRAFVKQKFEKKQPSSDFKEKLKAQILAASKEHLH